MVQLMNELAETIKGCSRCGFCMVECPTYGATKIEWDAARGRINLAGELASGSMALDEELYDPADTCLMCRSCYENCPSKIDTPKAMQIVRAMRFADGKMPLPYRLVFEKVFPHPKFMSFGAHVLSGAQALKLFKMLDNQMVARAMPIFGDVISSVPDLPIKQARQSIPLLNKAVGKRQGRVLYFLGCATDFVYPEIACDTVRILQMQGMEVIVPPVSCCGLPAFTYGHMTGAKFLAQHNLEIFGRNEFDAIVGDCTTCISFLKEYGQLFDQEEEEKQKNLSVELAEKCYDITAFLAKFGCNEFNQEIKQNITLHMPCHVARYLNTTKVVENMAQSIPGVNVIKADNQNICCGGAGSYCFSQPGRSKLILDRKMEGIYQTDAEIVSTVCPACIMQIQSGLKRNAKRNDVRPVKVMHLVQLLAKAY